MVARLGRGVVSGGPDAVAYRARTIQTARVLRVDPDPCRIQTARGACRARRTYRKPSLEASAGDAAA